MCTLTLHCTVEVIKTCPNLHCTLLSSIAEVLCIYIARAHELLLKIMAVLAKVGTLREQLPSVLVDPCLYNCCTVHQALAVLRSLCTEGCIRTARSTCVGVRNVIREFIWTEAARKFGQVLMTSTVRAMPKIGHWPFSMHFSKMVSSRTHKFILTSHANQISFFALCNIRTCTYIL